MIVMIIMMMMIIMCLRTFAWAIPASWNNVTCYLQGRLPHLHQICSPITFSRTLLCLKLQPKPLYPLPCFSSLVRGSYNMPSVLLTYFAFGSLP